MRSPLLRIEELVDLELGDVIGKDTDNAWHGDSPRLRRSGSMPGILPWAPRAIPPLSARCPVPHHSDRCFLLI
jgi:hypothetical protein